MVIHRPYELHKILWFLDHYWSFTKQEMIQAWRTNFDEDEGFGSNQYDWLRRKYGRDPAFGMICSQLPFAGAKPGQSRTRTHRPPIRPVRDPSTGLILAPAKPWVLDPLTGNVAIPNAHHAGPSGLSTSAIQRSIASFPAPSGVSTAGSAIASSADASSSAARRARSSSTATVGGASGISTNGTSVRAYGSPSAASQATVSTSPVPAERRQKLVKQLLESARGANDAATLTGTANMHDGMPSPESMDGDVDVDVGAGVVSFGNVAPENSTSRDIMSHLNSSTVSAPLPAAPPAAPPATPSAATQSGAPFSPCSAALALDPDYQALASSPAVPSPPPAQLLPLDENIAPKAELPYLGYIVEWGGSLVSLDQLSNYDGIGYWFNNAHDACPLSARHRHNLVGGVLFPSFQECLKSRQGIAPRGGEASRSHRLEVASTFEQCSLNPQIGEAQSAQASFGPANAPPGTAAPQNNQDGGLADFLAADLGGVQMPANIKRLLGLDLQM